MVKYDCERRPAMTASSLRSLCALAIAICISLLLAGSGVAEEGETGTEDRPGSSPTGKAPTGLIDAWVASLDVVDSAALLFAARETTGDVISPAAGSAGDYVVLAWNDLGMHCYNRDFQDLAVLPPYNNLWAQVIRRGDPPERVTAGLTVSYAFQNNTYSVGKSNFWDYDVPLFGVDLAPNVGLRGKGLAGVMDAKVDHFVAEGIPLTEFFDSDWSTPYPYQLATIIVRSTSSGAELARTETVGPVSTEMHCDNCHYDGGVEGISTGRVETNILTLHDGEDDDAALSGVGAASLMPLRPVLCADCHASNALEKPGQAGVPSLSNAMHEKHAGKVPDTTEGCYNCHPGPTTQCLRDVMSHEFDMGCVDCHGGMEQVAKNANPWLSEPRCDTCHDSGEYDQNAALYRMSTGHGGVYCAGCHDSPHAIAPSTQPNDAIKFIALQGHDGPIDTCTVCHLTQPANAGPHGTVAGTEPTPSPSPSPEPTLTPVPTSNPGTLNEKLYVPMLH